MHGLYPSARAAGKMLVAISMITGLWGCATLKDNAPVKPEANIQGVDIAGISSKSVDLLVDLAINNPNSFGLKTSGLDLSLSVEGSNLAKIDDQEHGISLKAKGTSTTQIPLSLNFSDIYDAVGNIKDKDEFSYAVDAGVTFNLPVIGNVRLPAKFEGVLPIPKIPEVSIRSAKLSKVNWNGASMLVELDVSNPNQFGLDLNSLNYQIQAAGQALGGGQVKQLSIGEKSTQTVAIPLDVSFSKLGSSLISMITSGKSMDLNLTGDMNLNPALEIWKPGTIDFDLKGLLEK